MDGIVSCRGILAGVLEQDGWAAGVGWGKLGKVIDGTVNGDPQRRERVVFGELRRGYCGRHFGGFHLVETEKKRGKKKKEMQNDQHFRCIPSGPTPSARDVSIDAGGFGRAMFEVSERYERMYAAIADGNLELAMHHWDTIEGSLNAGIVRRPAREANARAFILDVLWGEVAAVFEGGDVALAEEAFMRVRAACMGCHVAEERPYLNDQPMFNDLVFP